MVNWDPMSGRCRISQGAEKRAHPYSCSAVTLAVVIAWAGSVLVAARLTMSSSLIALGAVVYPDSEVTQLFTTEGADDIVVKRRSAVE